MNKKKQFVRKVEYNYIDVDVRTNLFVIAVFIEWIILTLIEYYISNNLYVLNLGFIVFITYIIIDDIRKRKVYWVEEWTI